MPTDTLAVPVLALRLLSPLQPGDGGVLVTYGGGARCWYDERTSTELDAVADSREPRVRVADSRGPLLRVLCRHLGWDGSHRPLMRVERRGRSLTGDPGWALRSLTKWGDAPILDDGPNFYARLPTHIGADLDHDRALAEAVVWHARIARMGCGFARSPEALALAEERAPGGPMPPLEVTP